MSDEELETALRRVLSTSRRGPCRREARARRGSQSLPPQKRAFAWWPAALMDVSFAPAWPRVAALAGAAVLGISIGLSNVGTRIATDLDLVRVAAADDASTNAFDLRRRTTPMTMTMTMPDRSSRWLLDRLARAEPVFHRHDRLARGAPLRDARAARRDGAPAHRGGAHRAARGAAAGGRCREAARRVSRARSRSRRRARRAEQGLRARARRVARASRSIPQRCAPRSPRCAPRARPTIRSCRRSC